MERQVKYKLLDFRNRKVGSFSNSKHTTDCKQVIINHSDYQSQCMIDIYHRRPMIAANGEKLPKLRQYTHNIAMEIHTVGFHRNSLDSPKIIKFTDIPTDQYRSHRFCIYCVILTIAQNHRPINDVNVRIAANYFVRASQSPLTTNAS